MDEEETTEANDRVALNNMHTLINTIYNLFNEPGDRRTELSFCYNEYQQRFDELSDNYKGRIIDAGAVINLETLDQEAAGNCLDLLNQLMGEAQ